MDEKKRKGGGGKLVRSQTVTVRLDERLRYLAELAARRQRRTLSSYIEWAVEQSFDVVEIEPGQSDATLSDHADDLWDIDEADRVLKLAVYAQELMSVEEQRIVKVASEAPFFVTGNYQDDGRWYSDFGPRAIVKQRFREHFDALREVAAGTRSKSSLPEWTPENALLTPPPRQANVHCLDGIG